MSKSAVTTNELLNKNMVNDNTRFSSTNFWHYCSLSTVNAILKSKSFYCRTIKDMNDKNEANLHKKDSEFIHALCFCNSNSEKIPMWYLYAGLTGEGMSIGVKPSIMKEFISSIRTVKTIDGDRVLRIGSDFELQCGWIYYRKQSAPSDIFYRNKWYTVTDYDSGGFEEGNYFIKDYPWEYEKEFRIIIKNKTGSAYDKLKIDIPDDVYNSLKLKSAPEVNSEKINEMLPDLDGVRKYLSKTITKSTLHISMGLMMRNKDNILDYILNSLLQNDDMRKVYADKICSRIRNMDSCHN